MHEHAEFLAGTPHCNVQRCVCGVIHVTVGPVSLRLLPEAARELRDALAVGLEVEARRGRVGELDRRLVS
ncbi:MAG: hypothetical protein H6713_33435 [Myxococcales bacterium]|nr:hypothetical protein [Myxococcales bacterium]